jgi:hypothetical protein
VDLDGFVGWADDLYLAVLAAHSSEISNAVPVRSTVAAAQVDVGALLDPGEVTLTGVAGSLVWNGGPDQELRLRGVGLEPEMAVEVVAGGNVFQLAARAADSSGPRADSGAPFTASPGIGEVVVKGFNQITHWGSALVELVTEKMFAAAPRPVDKQPDAVIPLGGRLRFQVMRLAGENRLRVIPAPDPARGELDCAGQVFVPDVSFYPWAQGKRLTVVGAQEVTYTFQNPVDQPHPYLDSTSVPLAERETNRCDPSWDQAKPNGVLYLRGVRIAKANEKGSVKVETATPDPVTGQKLRGGIDFLVGQSSFNPPRDAPGEAVQAIVEAASETGTPPQFMLAQLERETQKPEPFSPGNYRYEPITIDFNRLSGEGADATSGRANDYFQRHLRAGGFVAGALSQCWVFRPAGTTLPGSLACANSGPGSGTSLTIPGAPLILVETVAALLQPGNVTLTRVSPPTLTYACLPVGARKCTWQEVVDIAAPPNAGQFRFDPTDNLVTLGQALTDGQWLELSYEVVKRDPQVIQSDACASVDAASLNGPRGQGTGSWAHPQTVTFDDSDSVASFMLRNHRHPQHLTSRWMGTTSEKRLRWVIDPLQTGANRFKGLLDSRYRAASAQFHGAGSFGLFHATVLDWEHSRRAPILDKAFNLNKQCLKELRTTSKKATDVLTVDRRDANLLAARHSFGRSELEPNFTCASDPCDQSDWARKWSLIVETYNSRDDFYKVVNGISAIVRSGIQNHDPK